MRLRAIALTACLLCITMYGQQPGGLVAHPGSDLQALIDQVSTQGGGRITFPKGEYHTGQLELKSGALTPSWKRVPSS